MTSSMPCSTNRISLSCWFMSLPFLVASTWKRRAVQPACPCGNRAGRLGNRPGTQYISPPAPVEYLQHRDDPGWPWPRIRRGPRREPGAKVHGRAEVNRASRRSLPPRSCASPPATTGLRTAHEGMHDLMQRLYLRADHLRGLWFGLRGGMATATSRLGRSTCRTSSCRWGGAQARPTSRSSSSWCSSSADRGSSPACSPTGCAPRFDDRRRAYSRCARSPPSFCAPRSSSARRAVRRPGRAVGELAHEIRNPLGSSRCAAEILRDRLEPRTRCASSRSSSSRRPTASTACSRAACRWRGGATNRTSRATPPRPRARW